MVSEKQWYVVRHRCGAVFTLNPDDFESSQHDPDTKLKRLCPNCGKSALSKLDFENLNAIFKGKKELLNRGVDLEVLNNESEKDVLFSVLRAIGKGKTSEKLLPDL